MKLRSTETRFRAPRRPRLWLALAVLASLAPTALPAAVSTTSTPPAAQDYSAFKLITDRNIFNSRRYARSSGRQERASVARYDTFTLVGTMNYEKGPFAFFEGSSSEYRKVLQPSGTIAGYTVTGIAPSFVKLASGTNELQLRVGMQMRRPEQGEWQVASVDSGADRSAGRPSVPPGPGPTIVRTETRTNVIEGEPQIIVIDPNSQTVMTDPAGDEANTNGTETASSTTDDPVLRRLMQRREQELNR